MGPNSRALLQKVSRADFSNEGFPFATIREVGVGHATVLASRRTYMGELGWELYVPVEFAVTVFETLHEAGAEFGLRDAGYYAVESLRLEKGYRAWGRELTPDDTPFQAGLGWAVKLDKPGGFIGQKALVEAKGKPLARRLVSVVLEDGEPLLWGGETLLRDGKPVGDLTSAGYGHTVGASVGLGYVKRDDGAAIDAAWLEQRQVRGRPRRHAPQGQAVAALPLRSGRRADQGLSLLEARVGQLAGRLEDRIGHRRRGGR